jgi:hypothetical protein
MKEVLKFPWGAVVPQSIYNHTSAPKVEAAQPSAIKKHRSEKQRQVSKEFFSRAEARRASARLTGREQMLKAIMEDTGPTPDRPKPFRGRNDTNS